MNTIGKWIWPVPLAIAAVGYFIVFLMFSAHVSVQCIGFRIVFMCILVSVVVGAVSVFVVGFARTRYKILKSGVAVLGSLLSLPLVFPVILALGGVHAGDTVCTMAASFEKPPSLEPFPGELIQGPTTFPGPDPADEPQWPSIDCSLYGTLKNRYPNCK